MVADEANGFACKLQHSPWIVCTKTILSPLKRQLSGVLSLEHNFIVLGALPPQLVFSIVIFGCSLPIALNPPADSCEQLCMVWVEVVSVCLLEEG